MHDHLIIFYLIDLIPQCRQKELVLEMNRALTGYQWLDHIVKAISSTSIAMFMVVCITNSIRVGCAISTNHRASSMQSVLAADSLAITIVASIPLLYMFKMRE